MVINGPVAKAGSILYFFNVRGTKAPKSAAKTITARRARLTVTLNNKLYPSK